MKELILWKEVDVKDELPQTHDLYITVFEGGKIGQSWYYEDTKEWENHLGDVVTHWLKRVVITILSSEEIKAEAKKEYENVDNNYDMIYGYKEGYKAMQERLIGGEGL